MQNNDYAIKMGTEHEVFKVKRWLYILIDYITKAIYLGIGIGIFYYLVTKCLHDANCNPIVTTYLSVISLACFINLGLPADKMGNILVK